MSDPILPSPSRLPHNSPSPARASLDYIYPVDAEPICTPTGETNARACRCAWCNERLEIGMAERWDYDLPAYSYVRALHGFYLCPRCHAQGHAMLEIQPRVARAMRAISAWCGRYVNLGMGYHAAQYIDGLVGRCGLQGAEVAEAILERLPALTDYSYAVVRSAARQVAMSMVEMEGVS